MSDDTQSQTSLLGRLKAALTQDGDAEPQARDESPIAISREEHTQEPGREEIERYITEYERNPLIRQSVRKFASDVLEPGVEPDVDTGDGESMPTVPQDYAIPEYRGLDLDDALARWLSTAGIAGGRFKRDVTDVLEDVIIDLRGRRGSAIVEHAYDDPVERERILGLRAFRTETVTAYTFEGKAILLRPDDDPDADAFETVAIRDFTGDFDYDGAPQTPAGKTAAFVQFDDIFGQYEERDDIPFALDDVAFISNDPDTGAIFGRPDTASVVERSSELREMFNDTAQGIKSVGYGHWLAEVDTDDEDEARNLLDSIDPSSPEYIDVVNYAVELEQFDSDVPDTVEHIQQTIEYILAALPTPLYRVGFAGDINRDITDVQQDDYREQIQRERDRLESALHDTIHQKAREFLFGDAKSDQDLPVDVGVAIEPADDDSPLTDEDVDAKEFSQLMKGLKAAAPGGAVEQVVPPHELRETFLGLDPEPPEAPAADPDAAMSLPDETDPQVRETFRDAYLGRRYSEGDIVQSPQGLGVVTEIRTEDFQGKDGTVEASDSSPTYIVALKDARVGVGFYKASQLDAAEMPDTGVDEPAKALAEENAATAAVDVDGVPVAAQLADTTFDIPESWQQSETSNRLILLDAWASMNGQFDCGGGCCMSELNSERLCAAMKDRVLGWEGWRKSGN